MCIFFLFEISRQWVAEIDWFELLTFVRRVLEEIDEVGDVRELCLWLLLIGHVSTSGVNVKSSEEVTVIVANVVVLHIAFEKSENRIKYCVLISI